MARIRAALFPLLCAALGIFMAHRPMLATGLARVQTDPGDSRLHNYTLEHEFRWVTGAPAHGRFWSPPIFYPVENSGAYTDVLIGTAPPYFLFRACGAAPDTAFQLWMIALSALNFAGAYLLFRRGCGISPAAAALGAFIVAFASLRVTQLAQQQLYASFFVTTAIYAAIRIFDLPRVRPAALWWALLYACIVAQFYSGFYIGWFLVFTSGLAGLFGLALARWRPALLEVLRRDWGFAVGGAALAAAALFPLVRHYLEAARVAGYRSWEEDVLQFLPTWKSWVYLGPQSWVYGWLARVPTFAGNPFDQEHRLGLGLATTAAAVLGLARERRRPLVGVAILVSAALILLTTNWPGDASAWRVVFEAVPGAKALRAVSRVAHLLLVPAGLGVAIFFEKAWAERRLRPVLALFAAACALEQGQTTSSYDKHGCRARAAAIAREVAPGSDAFLFSPVSARDPWYAYHLDAMEAELLLGIPTVNGYSGLEAPGWPFVDVRVNSQEDAEARAAALAGWIRKNGLESKKVCWVTIQERY